MVVVNMANEIVGRAHFSSVVCIFRQPSGDKSLSLSSLFPFPFPLHICDVIIERVLFSLNLEYL